MSREHPIIFGADSVRAILAGRKTQTRRVVKPQPHWTHGLSPAWGRSPDGVEFGTPNVWCENGPDYPDGPEDERRCPYGTPGDRLWVRERFASYTAARGWAEPCESDRATYVVFTDGAQLLRVDRSMLAPLAEYAPGASDGIRWRPSIFMPRWASRLTLELTDVHVEQLQVLTREDAIAEGCPEQSWYRVAGGPEKWFRTGWDELNGARGYPWLANPWVWVLTFCTAHGAPC